MLDNIVLILQRRHGGLEKVISPRPSGCKWRSSRPTLVATRNHAIKLPLKSEEASDSFPPPQIKHSVI